jgi:hypothetical protein
MGGRRNGDVYINDDTDIFANGFGVEDEGPKVGTDGV